MPEHLLTGESDASHYSLLAACCQVSRAEFFERLQVEAEGDVATAVTLARILSNIPLSRGGPTSVVIFDIHALQVLPQFPSVAHVSCVCPGDFIHNNLMHLSSGRGEEVHSAAACVCMCFKESAGKHMMMGLSRFW